MQATPPITKWLVVPLLVLASGLAGYLAVRVMRPAPLAGDKTPPLTLSPSTRTLGELREGEVTTRKLTIENGGTEDVHISRFHGDCRCATFKPMTLTVPAGGSADVEVEIRQGQTAAERFALSLLAEGMIGEGGRDARFEWKVAGRIVRDAELSVKEIDFGEVTEDRLGALRQTVRVKATRPLEWVTATSPTPAIKAEASGSDIVIHALAALPAAPWRVPVRVEVKFKDGEQPVKIVLPVTLQVLPAIEAVPERILAGPRRVGDVGHEEVVLVSRAGCQFSIVDLGVSEPSLKIERVGTAEGVAPRFRLEYSVRTKGANDRLIWIEVKKAGESKSRRIIVPVQAVGY